MRFHGLLDDDMGTLVSQNEKLLYSFFNIDSIFDYLLSIGMQPFAELSFMPPRWPPAIRRCSVTAVMSRRQGITSNGAR